MFELVVVILMLLLATMKLFDDILSFTLVAVTLVSLGVTCGYCCDSKSNVI
jgi:uncharacterized membrane protein